MSGEDVTDIWNGCMFFFLPRLSEEPILRWVEIEFGQFSDHDFLILVFIILCFKVLIFFEKLIDFLAEINTREQLDVSIDEYLTGRSVKVKYTFLTNLSIFSSRVSRLST